MFGSTKKRSIELPISHRRLKLLRPELYGVSGMIKRWKDRRNGLDEFGYITKQLDLGVCQAAIVVWNNPVLVAAYSRRLDCVAMLKFDNLIFHHYQLTVGTRLLTHNFYRQLESFDSDLTAGPLKNSDWTGFNPLIVDFVTDETEKVLARKQLIKEEEWVRAYNLGVEYMQQRPGIARHGKPMYSLLEGIERY